MRSEKWNMKMQMNTKSRQMLLLLLLELPLLLLSDGNPMPASSAIVGYRSTSSTTVLSRLPAEAGSHGARIASDRGHGRGCFLAGRCGSPVTSLDRESLPGSRSRGVADSEQTEKHGLPVVHSKDPASHVQGLSCGARTPRTQQREQRQPASPPPWEPMGSQLEKPVAKAAAA